MTQWTLVNEKGERVNIGDTLTTFRGERVTLTGGAPPHKPESTGRVFVEHQNGGRCDSTFYPNVVGCRFVRE